MNEGEWHRARRWVSVGIVAFLVLVGVGVVLAAIAFAFRGASASYPYPFLGFPWFFGLFLIFFLFWGLRWWAWPGHWGYGPYAWRHGDAATSILRERYARGEIGKEQFDQMMRDLDRPT